MQFGFSSYSFYQHLRTGEMSLYDVIDWIAASDATHMEIATVSLSETMGKDTSTLDTDEDLVQKIKAHAADKGVVLSNLVVPANLVTGDVDAEMERMKRYIDAAGAFGMSLFRHDVSEWAYQDKDIAHFESLLPSIVDRCRDLAQYAKQYGITTSIENHGLMMNGGERVRRLIHLVDEPNFKTTLDVGNFMSVDEDARIASTANAPYASIIHLKDFYVRSLFPGEGWSHTPGGTYIQGSIVGYGDLDMRGIVKGITDSGFDGFVSIEFEGIEECLMANEIGLANTLRLFADAGATA